ncbi:MAG: hypothetical protein PHI93_00500 [Kiritimatiellae bacterium]|nr:hypothetical protein [Kiritimatiellia bacterium]
MENFFGIFPRYGNFFRNFSTLWKTGIAGLYLLGAGVAEASVAPRPELASMELGIWCEFMPYAQVAEHLPLLAAYDCDLLLHVRAESLRDPDFARLLRAAEQTDVAVMAWLLLPVEEHLYVGQASVEATRALAHRVADYIDEHQLRLRGFIFDCEPSPLLGREMFTAVRAKSLRQLAQVLQRELDAEEFHRDTAALHDLTQELRERGYQVNGAANRAFLDAQSRGNLAMEDGLNAPVSGVAWDALSFITYRYGASHFSYIAMLNRYATLARELYGARAALDVGLLGDYDHIPENAERAELFGGGDFFYNFLRGMSNSHDLEEAVGVVLGCGVRQINLYALDGAVESVAGLENWLKAARGARPRTSWGRWTPVRSVHYGALGALTEKLFRWFTGGSEATHGQIVFREPAVGAGERQP